MISLMCKSMGLVVIPCFVKPEVTTRKPEVDRPRKLDKRIGIYHQTKMDHSMDEILAGLVPNDNPLAYRGRLIFQGLETCLSVEWIIPLSDSLDDRSLRPLLASSLNVNQNHILLPRKPGDSQTVWTTDPCNCYAMSMSKGYLLSIVT